MGTNPGERSVSAEDGVEVRGRAVLQVVDGMPDPAEDKARAILAEMGIEDPDPEAWYPRRAWLDTFEAVHERIGEATVREIGRTVAGNVRWPDDAETFPDHVAAVDRAYRVNLRGDDDGGYEVEDAEEGVVVHCRTPHPAPFDEALVKETARAYCDDQVSQVTRAEDESGDALSLEVSWWGMGE